MAENASGSPKTRWDDSKVKRAYADECNVSTRPEEFILSFGVNQGSQAEDQETVIQLGQRVIMNPYVAKRLAFLLGNVVREYESRFGPYLEARKEGDSDGTV